MTINQLYLYASIKKYPQGYYLQVVAIEEERVKIKDIHKGICYWVSKNTLERSWASFQRPA